MAETLLDYVTSLQNQGIDSDSEPSIYELVEKWKKENPDRNKGNNQPQEVEETEAGKDKPYKKGEEEEEMSSEESKDAELDLSAYATKEQLVEALGQLHTELSEMISKVVSENESLKEDLEKVSKMSAVTPVKHSQTNLSKQSVETGIKHLDMILNLKNNN